MPPPTLVTTAGAADANSFASVAEFKTYWSGRLYNTLQLAAVDDTIVAALIETGKLLNGVFLWTGLATAPLVQAMAFPRTGMLNRNGGVIDPATNPPELKDAQCEWAGQLIAGDLTGSNAVLAGRISSIKAGPVALTWQTSETWEDIRRQQPEFAYLSAVVPDMVRNLLPPSWYLRQELQGSISFEARR